MRRRKLKTEGQQHTHFGWNAYSWASHKAKATRQRCTTKCVQLISFGSDSWSCFMVLKKQVTHSHKGMTEREWLRLTYTL